MQVQARNNVPSVMMWINARAFEQFVHVTTTKSVDNVDQGLI